MSMTDIEHVRDLSRIAKLEGMAKGWRERLSEAIDESGRSPRSISLGAGLSDSYIAQIFNKGVEPTVAKLEAICNELDISLTWVMTGVEITPEVERLMSAWATLSADARDSLVKQSRGSGSSAVSRAAPQPSKPATGSKARPRSASRTR